MTEQVCRPVRLTCRWVREMTQSIHTLCPSILPVVHCTQAEHEWAHYWQQLEKSRCIQDPQVQQVLRYERDYQDILQSDR